MAQRLRTAVYGKMFGTGCHIQIDGIFTLKPAYHCNAHFSCQYGVFAVRFVSSAPTRIAENINVGSPKG